VAISGPKKTGPCAYRVLGLQFGREGSQVSGSNLKGEGSQVWGLRFKVENSQPHLADARNLWYIKAAMLCQA
jgi:hypothetical protein